MNLIVLQKVREQENILAQDNFKSLTLTFGSRQYRSAKSKDLTFKIISCQNVLSSQNLIPCFLLFVALLNSIPTYLLNFKFFIILQTFISKYHGTFYSV